jgi:hypothetical protein
MERTFHPLAVSEAVLVAAAVVVPTPAVDHAGVDDSSGDAHAANGSSAGDPIGPLRGEDDGASIATSIGDTLLRSGDARPNERGVGELDASASARALAPPPPFVAAEDDVEPRCGGGRAMPPRLIRLALASFDICASPSEKPPMPVAVAAPPPPSSGGGIPPGMIGDALEKIGVGGAESREFGYIGGSGARDAGTAAFLE